MIPLIDAHLDISWNAMSHDRDQLRSIAELRAAESHMMGKARGRNTVSLPEMRKAQVGICLATVLSRAMPAKIPAMSAVASPIGQRVRGEVIMRDDLDFANQTIASATGQGQLAYYQLLEAQGEMSMIRTAGQIDEFWSNWQIGGSESKPIGYILSMEGADPIIEPDHAQWWWDHGLRTVSLAHYGPSAYAMGTGGDGPLTDKGRQLLKEFDRLGIILDLVHTADTALSQAMEIYNGPVFVSHGNCRALVDHDRQISDEQIRRIAERGGMLGVVLDCWMLTPTWLESGRDTSAVSLETVADHIDHICQLLGNTDHVGIGSDLDGGFGAEQTPHDLDTIVDIQKLASILPSRGYSDDAVNAIFHGNWLRFFRKHLPAR